MGRYIARRLLQSLLVLVFVVLLVFVLARLTGDPTDLFVPEFAPEAMRQAFRAEHGLDQPILVQLGRFVADVAHGDFGDSIWQNVPALPLVLSRLPLSLELALATTAFSFVVALILGAYAALRPLSLADRLVTFFSLIGVTVPSFWLALLLILLFAVELRLLPTSGRGSWRHLILPGITLSWGTIGGLAQVVRASMLEQLSMPFVMTARAKGLTQTGVLAKHVARNAIIPVITVASYVFVGLANGAVIVETVFGWPGVGKLTVDAITRRDFPVVQSAVFVVAIMVVLINLALDLCYAAIDPRIRYE